MREEYNNKQRRWYDRDPILSRSMKTLEASDDETQIKVALNLIKIIVEHNLAFSEYTDVNEIIEAVEDPNKKFFIGVQWHPESLEEDIYSERLFDTFINSL